MKITKIIAKRRGIYAGNRRFLDCIDGTIIKKVKETMNNAEIGKAMVIKLDPVLPEYPTFKEGVRRAPKRELTLNKREIKLAVANALRYVPEYRFMPKERIYGKPIDEYKGECIEGSEILIGDIVLNPHEVGVIKQWNTKAGIRVAARKQSRLGICRAEL